MRPRISWCLSNAASVGRTEPGIEWQQWHLTDHRISRVCHWAPAHPRCVDDNDADGGSVQPCEDFPCVEHVFELERIK
jgi:hypothetical protein